ncbi:MAG: hypothetical protein MJE68_30885 [Proteobacteria bacterium]|nr:hypothetical protein [Pseudomonadota bacterium]
MNAAEVSCQLQCRKRKVEAQLENERVKGKKLERNELKNKREASKHNSEAKDRSLGQK